jgi:outer membrane protein assembly factor BamB
MCYLNFGPGERSFLVALDLETGAIVWTHDEPINTQGTAEAPFTNSDFYGSWSTPVVASIAGREQIVISFPFRVCGLDPRDGKMLWSSDGLNALVYTSPLIDKETVVSMGGYSGMSLGLRVGHSGAVPPISRLWHHPKTKQRIGSGVVHQGHIYIHNSTGIAECFELETGRLVWEQRLAGKGGSNTNWSSIMTAAGLCYTITQGGDCFVFRASPNFELVAMNALGESSNSSVVPSDGQLFIRTHQHLWCVGLPALNR